MIDLIIESTKSPSLWFYGLAGVFNAVHDILAHKHSQSVFRKFPPTHFFGALSWKRKWKNHDKAQGPAFFLSSTAFVFLTDGWHLAEFLQWTVVLLAIFLFHQWPLSFVEIMVLMLLFRAVYGFMFNLFYQIILKL